MILQYYEKNPVMIMQAEGYDLTDKWTDLQTLKLLGVKEIKMKIHKRIKINQ